MNCCTKFAATKFTAISTANNNYFLYKNTPFKAPAHFHVDVTTMKSN